MVFKQADVWCSGERKYGACGLTCETHFYPAWDSCWIWMCLGLVKILMYVGTDTLPHSRFQYTGTNHMKKLALALADCQFGLPICCCHWSMYHLFLLSAVFYSIHSKFNVVYI
jgi:hypothetical protein